MKTTYKKNRLQAIVLTAVLIGTLFIVPAASEQTNQNTTVGKSLGYRYLQDPSLVLDTQYSEPNEPTILNVEDPDDAGYHRDGGNEITKAKPIYPGEMIDDTPGRGRTGKLSSTDKEDWYSFSVCTGQQITLTMTPPNDYDFDLGLYDKDGTSQASSNNSGSTTETITHTVDSTGSWYLRIVYVSGASQGQYSFTVNMDTQNDAGTAADAGDNFNDATLLIVGDYYGYLDMNDEYDWYKVQATSGQGIHVTLKMKAYASLSDYDISLYNPSGNLVYEETKYYDDEMLYPADVTGEWRIQITIFPGYTDIPQPTEWTYYTYGSGAYNLKLALDASAPAPPAPVPQPQIIPIAKTFSIANDPTSYKDDYSYLASIPACNYLAGGQRYLAPIVYTGDDTPTAYYDDNTSFGTVDDTTQYLVDDWNAYLAIYGKTPLQYSVPEDPIAAAAEIATENWASSSLAVVAVDGSSYQDEVKEVLKKTKTLKRTTEVTVLAGDDPDIQEFGYSMFVTPKWGAINVSLVNGSATTEPTLNNVIPKFLYFISDFWPDTAGQDKIDIYYPITWMGMWAVSANSYTSTWDFQITKYAGDRYRIRIGDQDTTLKVTVNTDEPNDLLVFLVDPKGHLRAPDIPYWNGGEVLPIHQWNGFPNATGFADWRLWDPDPHTEFTAEVLHPEKGLWTAIVVPRHAEGSDTIPYTVTGTVKTINQDGADAAMSAANAAVIASLNHAPLLYVTEDSIPAATASAFTTLGVNNVIFVERGEIGSAVADSLPTITKDLTTMQQIIDEIKSYDASENYITITSLKTGDGFFAPAAMLAAYHGSPVLRIDEADGNPAGLANRIETWRLWSGDYYHGERSCGHLPKASAPIEKDLKLLLNMTKYLLSGGAKGSLPAFGMDADRYWNEELHTLIYNWIDSYGLDIDGQEAYCFVAPRNDIYIPVLGVMTGNNSYAGDIPGLTPAYASAIINRDVLYPALIYANPGKDITTAQLMNFPDITGGYNQWTTNDGVSHSGIASSHATKQSFSSHFRQFEGHCLWDAHLQRMNDGASIMYYSGHGTGGSGISAQYYTTAHGDFPGHIWYDAWRSYMYDSWGDTTDVSTPRANGFRWYNPESPNLYDIIHYKWVDQLTENLHSNTIFYMSCTTADADGPMVYLDHGAALWYGNAATGLCPPDDLRDDIFFEEAMVNGLAVGPAFAKNMWLFCRDYTTSDSTAMYGVSSMSLFTLQTIYGDPNLIIYSPEWNSPVPIDA